MSEANALRQRVLDLWFAGKDRQEIMRTTLCTLGQIAGIVRRARLAGDSRAVMRPSPIFQRPATEPKPPKAKRPPQGPEHRRKPGQLPNAKARLAAIPMLAVPSRAGGCAWPVHFATDAPDVPLWCGHKVARGLFCAAHAAVAYDPTPMQRAMARETA